ncbi:MAG: hypothetical protein Q8Q00_12470 [Dehalococcoidia bacterium]|nr:hypothetical protein [Dehalococcoidia bacterium]
MIFVIVLAGYYLSTTELRTREAPNWFQHHLYLAQAMLNGNFDVGAAGIPDFYHDTVSEGTSKYVTFPPGPSILLLPFVAIWGTNLPQIPLLGTGFSQIYFSMVLGAVNAVLFWYLLGLLNISSTTKLLLVPFFAFGTVHFFTATTGTAWHYAHVSAVFFMLLAIIFLLRKASPVIPAVFLGLAFLSREPTILAAPFFAYWIVRQRHESIFAKETLLDRQSLSQMGLFAAGLVPFVAFWFFYNVARFGGPLDTGYDTLYERYGHLYPFYPHFGQFDVRNIPLHLYTLFFMPPDFVPVFIRPSPYGMSVVLTSPAFIYAAFVKRQHVLRTGSWLAIGFVSIPLLLHYSQGWVQFGYRFLLDFAPFLLILTAFGFDDNDSRRSLWIKVTLVGVSVVVGFWGRHWANALGW